jgi:hypothetical protein
LEARAMTALLERLIALLTPRHPLDDMMMEEFL